MLFIFILLDYQSIKIEVCRDYISDRIYTILNSLFFISRGYTFTGVYSLHPLCRCVNTIHRYKQNVMSMNHLHPKQVIVEFSNSIYFYTYITSLQLLVVVFLFFFLLLFLFGFVLLNKGNGFYMREYREN